MPGKRGVQKKEVDPEEKDVDLRRQILAAVYRLQSDMATLRQQVAVHAEMFQDILKAQGMPPLTIHDIHLPPPVHVDTRMAGLYTDAVVERVEGGVAEEGGPPWPRD